MQGSAGNPHGSYIHACRERLDQLERAWWEEEAELSTGPAEQGQGGTISDPSPEEEAGPSDWQVHVFRPFHAYQASPVS